MLTAAAFTHSRALLYLAFLVAISWLLSVLIYFYEIGSGTSLFYVDTAKDGVIAGLILREAIKPNFARRLIYIIVLSLFLVQAVYSLSITQIYEAGVSIDLPWWLRFGLNRTFELMLIIMIGYLTLRIIRVYKPQLHGKIWGVPSPPPMRDPTKTSRFLCLWRRLKDEFQTIEDDDDEFLEPVVERFKQEFLQRRRIAKSDQPDSDTEAERH